jgi:hypothetical protein
MAIQEKNLLWFISIIQEGFWAILEHLQEVLQALPVI